MRLLLLFIIILSYLSANDSAFIYGKITMRNGDTHTGSIRWGKDYGKEHFWFDTFDASKIGNEFEDLIDYREYRKSERRGFFASLERLFNKRRGFTTHVFACHFGDIKRIDVIRKNRAEVTLKNNLVYEVNGTDVGTSLYLLNDKTGEENKLNWSRIESIEFMETPSELKYSFGKPLYGVVETKYGSFEGFVQWDYDESLLDDKLDGDEREFYFEEIKMITKDSRRAVEVKTKDDRYKYLSGTNDVDRGNRGIAIKNHQFGKIEVEWGEFISFTIKKPSTSGNNYSSFKPTKKIRAEITFEDNETISGEIAYDLDETYDIEHLNGEIKDIKYSIPFRNIVRIEPFNRHKSEIELKNGDVLELSGERDVSYRNDGILIWKSKDEKPVYKKWRDIKLITIL